MLSSSNYHYNRLLNKKTPFSGGLRRSNKGRVLLKHFFSQKIPLKALLFQSQIFAKSRGEGVIKQPIALKNFKSGIIFLINPQFFLFILALKGANYQGL